MAETVEDCKREAEKKKEAKQMSELVYKDWQIDFGHCFPNLYEGLAEDIAELRAKRKRAEEVEEEGEEEEGGEEEEEGKDKLAEQKRKRAKRNK